MDSFVLAESDVTSDHSFTYEDTAGHTAADTSFTSAFHLQLQQTPAENQLEESDIYRPGNL